MDFLSNIFQNISSGKSKNIHLKEAGTLSNFISDDDKYKISSLTLSGEINGTDLRLLRDMAGYNYLGVHTNGTLHELDMTDVRIVKGGDSYVQMHVSSYYVETDDEIPERIFRKCYALKKVNCLNPSRWFDHMLSNVVRIFARLKFLKVWNVLVLVPSAYVNH